MRFALALLCLTFSGQALAEDKKPLQISVAPLVVQKHPWDPLAETKKNPFNNLEPAKPLKTQFGLQFKAKDTTIQVTTRAVEFKWKF